MVIFSATVVALVGYALGAIPFAVIIARFCGVNILKAGSGNPGATNVKRTCGKFAGNLCFVLDAAKGFFAAAWPKFSGYLGISFTGSNLDWLCLTGLVAAIIGHSFSVFLKFKGGKGVSVAVGGLLAVMIYPVLIGLLIWLAVFYSTRYVSLASIIMALSLPVSAAIIDGTNSIYVYFGGALAILIVFRHRSNIVRLIKGTENRF